MGTQENRKEKEMRDLMRADVNRTCQEFEYFRRPQTKDNLETTLFLWSKSSPLGYKQGMNEIIAIIMLVFDTERSNSDDNHGVFDPDFLLHDVYSFFERLLAIGVVRLYHETKDISDLKQDF